MTRDGTYLNIIFGRIDCQLEMITKKKGKTGVRSQYYIFYAGGGGGGGGAAAKACFN